MEVFVTKGMRVWVENFQIKAPHSCLSGNQMKFGADFQNFVGTIRHIRGDDPSNPTKVAFWVEPDEVAGLQGYTKMCPKCGVLEVGPLGSDCIRAVTT